MWSGGGLARVEGEGVRTKEGRSLVVQTAIDRTGESPSDSGKQKRLARGQVK